MSTKQLQQYVSENFEQQENGYISRKRAAVYIRYSSENQRDGYSVEYQLDECQKYIDDNGLVFMKSYIDEAVSGKSANNRTAFFEMLTDVKNGLYDCVVVYKYSRFARNLVEATLYRQQIEKAGAQLISAMERIDDTTPEGRMMRNIIMVMDEYYSDNLATFVQSAQYLAAKNGKVMGGGAPMGLKHNDKGTFDIVESEAEIIRLIFSMFADGVSQADILRSLDDLGYLTRDGIPFKSSTFRGILRNPKYIGRYELDIKGYEKVVNENAFDAIIDKQTWQRVQMRLADKEAKKEPRPRLKKRSYPLTGKAFCGCCHSPFIGSAKGSTKNGTRTEYNYYVCKGKDDKRVCDNKNIRKEMLESYVFSQIRENILNKEVIEKITGEIYEILNDGKKPTAESLKQLHAEKRKIDKKLEVLLDAFIDGDMPKSVLNKKSAALNEQSAALEKQIMRAEVANATAITPEKIKQHLLKMMYNLESGDAALQKTVVEQTVQKTIIHKERIEVVLQVAAENISPATNKELPQTRVENARNIRGKKR